jgi:hypothetical protein
MTARKPHRPTSTFRRSTFATLVAAVVFTATLSARAQEADPFAAEGPPAVPQSNVTATSRQTPASAPAGSDENFPTGLVERLPSSAYPEPVIRGLYGSSLWLDMQGHQWPQYPRIGVGVSGYGWVDTYFKRTRIGDPAQSDHLTRLFEQGRFALRLTPTYSNGSWFVQAQAELVANLETIQAPVAAHTDDLWVRTGHWKQWDVTVGRYEAFSVYHLGMGLDLNTDERIGAYDASNTPLQPYLASYLFYRPVGPANLALHLYPGGMAPGIAFLRPVRFEILGQWGNDGSSNVMGGRVALIYDLGFVKVRGAGEYRYRFPVDPSPDMHYEYKDRGVAGSVQFVLAPWVEFGPNIGRAITDAFTPSTRQQDGSYFPNIELSGDTWSYGGFLNFRPFNDMLIGGGANYTSFTNLHLNTATNQYDQATNTQYFAAIQYLIGHQLFFKVVGAYAKSHFIPALSTQNPYDDDMFSARVRLMYLY